MQVHLLMAGLMMLWGTGPAAQTPSPWRHQSGWLLLTLPCPVCATVIVFSLAFGLSLFPDDFPSGRRSLSEFLVSVWRQWA
jgi:predicted transporter